MAFFASQMIAAIAQTFSSLLVTVQKYYQMLNLIPLSLVIFGTQAMSAGELEQRKQ